jgi:hypothetical protein
MPDSRHAIRACLDALANLAAVYPDARPLMRRYHARCAPLPGSIPCHAMPTDLIYLIRSDLVIRAILLAATS